MSWGAKSQCNYIVFSVSAILCVDGHLNGPERVGFILHTCMCKPSDCWQVYLNSFNSRCQSLNGFNSSGRLEMWLEVKHWEPTNMHTPYQDRSSVLLWTDFDFMLTTLERNCWWTAHSITPHDLWDHVVAVCSHGNHTVIRKRRDRLWCRHPANHTTLPGSRCDRSGLPIFLA